MAASQATEAWGAGAATFDVERGSDGSKQRAHQEKAERVMLYQRLLGASALFTAPLTQLRKGIERGVYTPLRGARNVTEGPPKKTWELQS